MKIVKHIANLGYGSRKQVQWMFREGRITDAEGALALRGGRGVEVLQRSDGTHLAIFTDQWRAGATARDNPDIMLEPLPAGGAA